MRPLRAIKGLISEVYFPMKHIILKPRFLLGKFACKNNGFKTMGFIGIVEEALKSLIRLLGAS